MLLREEHGAMAGFLEALAEFDRERRWVELGYESLFQFLHRGLGLSRSSAHFRKTAAELVERFPPVLQPLRDGRLCISTVFQLAKVLGPDNAQDVLPRFFHCSKQEAMAVVADLLPSPSVPTRSVAVRQPSPAVLRLLPPSPVESVLAPEGPGHTRVDPALPSADPGEAHAPAANAPEGSARVAGQPVAPSTQGAAHSDPGATEPSARPGSDTRSVGDEPSGKPAHPDPGALAVAPVRRDEFVPLTPERARFHVTVSRGFLAKLEAAKSALSHTKPGATAGDLLEAGLDLVLAEHARRKGLVARPRAPGPIEKGRVPAHVRRAVWHRDRGCCQWPLDGGGICGSRLRVELDHVRARALGGEATVDGMRLLCRFHNQLAARLVFGDAWMDRFARGPRARPAGREPDAREPDAREPDAREPAAPKAREPVAV